MINLIHLDKTNELPKVKDLYFEAFPKYERVPFWLLMYKSKRKIAIYMRFMMKVSILAFCT